MDGFPGETGINWLVKGKNDLRKNEVCKPKTGTDFIVGRQKHFFVNRHLNNYQLFYATLQTLSVC